MLWALMGNFFGNGVHEDLNYTYTNHEEKDEFFEISINDINRTLLQSEEESVADILASIDRECDLLINKWKAEQRFLKSRMLFTEDAKFLENVHLVGGVDISFPKDKNDLVSACVCLVVLSYPELKLKYRKCEMVHLTSIYIPGYLAFREVEPIQKLCEELLQQNQELYPQIIFVDGNGLLHPMKFGLACHLGVVLNVPTVGIAKKLFHVDGLEKSVVMKNAFKSRLLRKGDTYDLVSESNFVYGTALRSTDHSSNPVFISVGNKITLKTAVRLVNNCCLYRIPEPVRLADQYSREHIRMYYENHVKEGQQEHAVLNKRFLELSEAVEKRKAEKYNNTV